MAHVSAPGDQGRQKRFPLAVRDAWAAPRQQHENQNRGGGGRDGEHRWDTPACDHDTGQGGAGRPGDVDADHVQPGGGGQLDAGYELGDQGLPGGRQDGLARADGER